MRRRLAKRLGAGLLLIASAAGVPGCAPSCGRPAGTGGGARRSLLVVTLDTTRRDAMGFLGQSPSVTPHLDALAAEGAVFEDAWTVAPLTLPAHASLMTGLYPLSHRLRDNAIAPLPVEATTLAEVLQAAGYATSAEVAAFVLDPSFGLNQGFAHYGAVSRDPVGSKLFMAERKAGVVVDDAIAALGRLEAPFFLWIHLFDAHFPYEAPGNVERRTTEGPERLEERRRCYLEEIRYADRELGRLFDELRRRPVWEDLVVVVAADHGECMGDGLEPTHGWFLQDATMRVPLLVRAPGSAPRRVREQVSLADVMPTLLELLGVERPDLRFDGTSLAGLVRGRQDELPDRALALESWYSYANFGWSPFEGCVDGAIKYVRAKRERLFDRAADPTERTDLAARGDPRAPALRRRLDTMLAEPAATLEPAGIELSEEDRARFRQLGYVESSLLDFSKRPDFTTLEDPEDHRELIQKLESVNQAFAEQRPDESIRLLREICQAAPDAVFAHEQLAAILLTLRKAEVLQEAEDHLKISLSIEPRRARSHFDLGLVYLRRMGLAMQAGDGAAATRHRRDAIAEFRLALDIDTRSPQALANLATLLGVEADELPASATAEKAKLYDQAVALFERFLEVLPAQHADRPRIEQERSRIRAKREALPR